MRQFAVAVAAAALLSGCSSIPGISALFPVSVSGEWVVTRPNFSSFTMTLFEENGTITGASQAGGAIKGARDGKSLYFTITHSNGSSTYYEGELSSNGKKITGTIAKNSGDTFIANRKP